MNFHPSRLQQSLKSLGYHTRSLSSQRGLFDKKEDSLALGPQQVVWYSPKTIGTLSKPRPQRQRRRGKTKGLMSRTMALRVHYKTLYISQPSSAKQQREITTFCVFKSTRVPTAIFSCFYWKMKPAFTIFSLR